jgi:hypothetical protein
MLATPRLGRAQGRSSGVPRTGLVFGGLADELVAANVSLIVAFGTPPSQAAKAATNPCAPSASKA